MFRSVLIANRGAIATRIIRTLKAMNIRSVAIYHEADAESLHVQTADIAVPLGGGTTADTYLNIDAIIAAAKKTGAEAIHPGYGFLSENTEFVSRCEQENLVFIGPTALNMQQFGLKHEARSLAEKAQVPLLPGSGLIQNLELALGSAKQIGYPVMLKSTAGGGGIGMQVCQDDAELTRAWDTVKRLSANYFANDGVFLEKYIAHARHIEMQIFGDGQGHAIALGERDCSAQRRNQKVIEESPAPNLKSATRKILADTAERLMASVNYRNAGTVEFIFDADNDAFYFLEVNTRLQVEHGVTEEVWGLDLVEWMILQAANALPDLLSLKNTLSPRGHAIQVRVYAEDPAQHFRPSAGLISQALFSYAEKARIDTWVESGTEVSALFDPMIAKIIVHKPNRTAAISALRDTLKHSELYGIETNLRYLEQILASDVCQQGRLLTKSLADIAYITHAVTVLHGGTQSTLQDFPGRQNLWHIGCPPSGPMDSVNFRLANALVGNESNAVALEMTLNGPSLKFHCDSVIALCGAPMQAFIDDKAINVFQSHTIKSGSVLKINAIDGPGARCYLAVAGGFQCPTYLGSRSTFTLGQFGGHNGRALISGDTLHLHAPTTGAVARSIVEEHRPTFGHTWPIRVIYGPHGAPDFFTNKDIQEFFDHDWEVHYNSSRTGIRLIGPKPKWARSDGGEAGLHPSNIHDNAYAFGSIDFTGDMPVILGPDGPSLGGFVCPATVITADLWKLGQLKAGAKVRFVPVSIDDAVAEERKQLAKLKQLRYSETPLEMQKPRSPILKNLVFRGETLVVRAAGDHFILLELGPMELDIERRLKIHALMLELEKQRIGGVHELTPGIRSLQIHFDSQQISVNELIEQVQWAAEALEKTDELRVANRVVRLPLSWDDEACKQAIEKYDQSVRKNAPWCPSNLEFIRRINGLDDIEDVKDIVFSASYLVMGLGDVYLGAPVATPIDPRHRLVTTKYNPARTWTAENSVGIGGAYMCIYGMEGPGGYQFIGRTLQMWNRYHKTPEFEVPWLLRFFDQIEFYEVSHAELQQIRQDLPLGRYKISIEESEFDLQEYRQLIADTSDSIAEFQAQRKRAFQQELDNWRRDGQLTFTAPEQKDTDEALAQCPANADSVESPVAGTVWKELCAPGDTVKRDAPLIILESMKMEIALNAPCDGEILKIHKKQGDTVRAGQSLIWIKKHD